MIGGFEYWSDEVGCGLCDLQPLHDPKVMRAALADLEEIEATPDLATVSTADEVKTRGLVLAVLFLLAVTVLPMLPAIAAALTLHMIEYLLATLLVAIGLSVGLVVLSAVLLLHGTGRWARILGLR